MAFERIVFAGSPAFAVTQLDAIIDAGLPVVGVLTQPDRPAGRKRTLQPTPVRARAEALGLPVATPKTLSRGEGPEQLAAWTPDLLVVAAYGLILPQAVLDLPAHGALNVHASLLPRWRGAAPVERAIMAGDEATGVCIMQMDAGLDTGAVRLAVDQPIEAGTTGGELEDALAALGATALVRVLQDFEAHPPIPQDEAGVEYAHKLAREEARLDDFADATTLARRINALNPRLPIGVTTAGGLRLRLLRARAGSATATSEPGSCVAVDRDGLHVACAQGTLVVHQLQLVGGKGTVLGGADLHNALASRIAVGEALHDA